MLQQNLTTIWNKLWKLHHETESLLTFFAKPKTSSEKLVKSHNELASSRKGPDGPNHMIPRYQKSQWIGLILGPLFFILTFFHPEGMTPEARGVLATTLWVATWWITEAIPIPATSLLPIVLLPLTGALEIGSVTSAYGDKTIFLFLGGFILAVAMEKWKLHKRIALTIISLLEQVRNDYFRIYGSDRLSVYVDFQDGNRNDDDADWSCDYVSSTRVDESIRYKKKIMAFGKAIMLAIAYSASIGGFGTLIGTPPNSIFAATVNKLYGIQISFFDWMLFGVPIAALLLFLSWIYLVQFAYPLKMKTIPGGREVVQKQLRDLGKMTFEETLVLIVFVLTAISWIIRSFVLQKFIPEIDDTMIVIIASILLFTYRRNIREKYVF